MDAKNRIINACGFSDEMKEYLKMQELSNYELNCIIAGSLLKLEKKMKLYKLINFESVYYDVSTKQFYDISSKQFYDESEKAIAEIKLKNGEILTMRECWYDYDILDEKREFSKVFTTYDAAMKYLKKRSRTKNGTKTHFAGQCLKNGFRMMMEQWKIPIIII